MKVFFDTNVYVAEALLGFGFLAVVVGYSRASCAYNALSSWIAANTG